MKLIRNASSDRKRWLKVNRVIETRRDRGKFCAFLLLEPGGRVCYAGDVLAQKKSRASRAKAKQEKPVNELDRLRDEFIKATNEYKTSLERLRASYEKDVTKAEAKLSTSKELFAQGLVARNDVAAAERGVAEAKGKVNETVQRMATADSQIASILLEADAEKRLQRRGLPEERWYRPVLTSVLMVEVHGVCRTRGNSSSSSCRRLRRRCR